MDEDWSGFGVDGLDGGHNAAGVIGIVATIDVNDANAGTDEGKDREEAGTKTLTGFIAEMDGEADKHPNKASGVNDVACDVGRLEWWTGEEHEDGWRKKCNR